MAATFRFGAIEVQAATQQLLVEGVPAALGARAFDLLLALIERRDRLVAKHELMDIVWRGQVVEEGNLHVQVSALRKLLGPAAITTIPGRGYRFVAALEGADGDGGAGGADRTVPGTAAQVYTKPSARADAAPPVPGNLGAHRQPLLGRETELQTLMALVQAQRLVTLVGAAGMGKTALAQAAAQALRTHWRHGVWWVDLASLSDPALLPQAVAQALRIARPKGGLTTAHLASVLASTSMLLVLDNCEHLIDAAGAFSAQIVNDTRGVHVLATSQELLNLPGEALFKLAPLALPAADEAPAVTGRHGAIQLFVERARAADGRFALSADNAQAVAHICRRLDGLPLAIELAAARVRLLGVQGLLEKLGERFRVLTGGARTAMRRHQTLRAAMDWSHGLLLANEQVVFRRLGVFVGGFALELAQGVAQDPVIDEWAVLDALGGLVDKSLVVAGATEGAEPPRYSLLETTRAYALEMLAAAGETDAWIARHAQVVCAFFERIEEARRGEHGTLSTVDLVRHTAPELDNARTALAWAGLKASNSRGAGDAGGADGADGAIGGQPVGDLDLAVGLAGSAMLAFGSLSLSTEAADQLMSLRGRLDGSVSPLRAARFWFSLTILGQSAHVPLAVALDAAERAEGFYRMQAMPRRLSYLLTMKAVVLTLAGEWQSAWDLLQASRDLTAPGWPARSIGARLRAQAWVHMAQGQFEQALALFKEMQTLVRAAKGESRFVLESESDLCRCLFLTNRYDECIALAQTAVAREGGASFGAMAVLLRYLLLAQACSGRSAQARQTLLEAMPRWRRHGLLLASGPLATVLAEWGCFADAARVGAAANAHLRRLQIEWYPSMQQLNERRQALLMAAGCSSDDLARWQREGELLDEASIAAICLHAAQEAPPA